jgi:hypothetical protein
MTLKEQELNQFIDGLKSKLKNEGKTFDQLKAASNAETKVMHENQKTALEGMSGKPRLKESVKTMTERNELASDMAAIMNLKADNKLKGLSPATTKYVEDFFNEPKNLNKALKAQQEYFNDFKKIDRINKRLDGKAVAPPSSKGGSNKPKIDVSGIAPTAVTQGEIKTFSYDKTESIRHTEEFSSRVRNEAEIGYKPTGKDLDYGIKMFDKNFGNILHTKADQQRAFDSIFIDGKSVNNMYKDMVPELTFNEKKCMVSAHIMARGGTVVDIMQKPNEKGESKIITMNPRMSEMSYDGPRTGGEAFGAVLKALINPLKWGSIGKIVSDYQGYNALQTVQLDHRSNLKTFTSDSKGVEFKSERIKHIMQDIKERGISKDGIEKESVDGFNKAGDEVKNEVKKTKSPSLSNSANDLKKQLDSISLSTKDPVMKKKK